MLVALLAGAFAAAAQEVLPRPESAPAAVIGTTLSDSTPAPLPRLDAPKGAPNVILVLLDDVGFGQTSAFGGGIATPALDRLAAEGVRFNRFHTHGICSPTRAELLTGRNGHRVGFGTVTESPWGFPGYTMTWPRSAASIAEVLRLNGFATAAFGKWHNTPKSEISPAGPFDHWPTHLGFDYFLGFLGGETDQFHPSLFENTRYYQPPPRPDYHLTTDLADHAIDWMRAVKSAAPDRPYFLYFATGGTHTPLQVPREWIDRFKGRFDGGWDRYRQETFERQKRMGIIPADAVLTARPRQMPAWDSLDADHRKVYARMMETMAGFTAHTDHEVGRVLEAARALGQWDNTLVIYVIGDNGASGEGGMEGLVDWLTFLNGIPEPFADKLARIDEHGSAKHIGHFPVPWAHAMNTPFQWTKRVTSHLGAVRNGMIMTWPGRIHDGGAIRGQFHHAIDVVPTLLEAIGLPAPAVVDGVAQKSMDGTSMLAAALDARTPERRLTQYFEVGGNRAIYDRGWWAGAYATFPWDPVGRPVDLARAKWELYRLDDDFTQAHDLAASEPAKLRELQDRFLVEAGRNDVLPFTTGRPIVPGGSVVPERRQFTYHPGAVRIHEAVAPPIKNRSWSIEAQVESLADGVLLSQGNVTGGGYSLFVQDGTLKFAYSLSGARRTVIAADAPLAAAARQLRAEFRYDGVAGRD
ncbi:MAG: arylsulfatase, partial [Gammaproteobacteria bacterium]